MNQSVPAAGSLQAIVDKASASIPLVGDVVYAPIHTHPDGEGRHRKKILQHLEKYPPPSGPGSMHIGAAGYFNLEIICKTRPQNVLLMDSNANQQRFWQELFQMFAENATPEAFRAALSERMVRGGFHCADGTFLNDRFAHEQPLQGLDYLDDAGNYEYLHQLAKEGRAAATTVNLVAEGDKSAAIGRALRDAGFDVETAYWSNISSFFQASRRGIIISRDDDIYGQKEQMLTPQGVHYKNSGFYKSDEHAPDHWQGYASQEERNAMTDSQVPAYERLLENTSALGGMETVHMHSHASDKIQNIKRHPLILSHGPLRRLPEQIEQRQQRREAGEPMWQDRVEAETPPPENIR